MKKIAPDKWKHFYVGIVLGAIVYRLSILLWPQQVIAAAVSIAVIIAICYGFELFSLISGKGHYEIKDAIAGIIGGLAGLALMLFLLW